MKYKLKFTLLLRKVTTYTYATYKIVFTYIVTAVEINI